MGRASASDLVHHLQRIGLTQYEAKIYIALSRAGALNGNEVSQASGVPSSKTYETVRKLVIKGAVAAYAEEGGTKYVALPPAQVIERYRDSMNQTLDHLESELGRLAVFEAEEHVLSMRGELSVLARARELIHAAQSEIYLSVWSEELPALRKALLDASVRHVQLHVMLYGDATDLEVRHVYHHAHAEIVRGRIDGRLLVLVADGRHSVIARFATGGEVYGCSSQNQALALLAREYLGHDIMLESAKDRIEREVWDAWWKSRQDLLEIIVGSEMGRHADTPHREEMPEFRARETFSSPVVVKAAISGPAHRRARLRGRSAYDEPGSLPYRATRVPGRVIVKPAPRTPLSALSLGAILLEAGMPEDALSVLPCSVEVARPLVMDARIKVLSFTGSGPVGWALKAQAGQKKVILELGGNGAVIVHADADLAWAAQRCAFGGFLRAGQGCIAVQRIYVHQDVYEPFLSLLITCMREITTGDPLDPATRMGPLVDEAAARRAETWVREAIEAGATLRTGGQRTGPYLEPTVLTGVTMTMRVSCEEVFAPIVTVVPYTTFDEALAWVNDTPYGLQAGVFCNDLGLVYHADEEVQVGGVIVNDVNTWRVDSMPYGGVKASGYGREGEKCAIEEFTEPRLLALKLP